MAAAGNNHGSYSPRGIYRASLIDGRDRGVKVPLLRRTERRKQNPRGYLLFVDGGELWCSHHVCCCTIGRLTNIYLLIIVGNIVGSPGIY